MPYAIHFENHDRGVVVTFEGIVTAEDGKAVNNQIYSPKHLPRLRYQIWNFLGATSHQVDSHELRNLIIEDNRASLQNPNQIIARVGSHAFFQGADRHAEIYASVWEGFEGKTFSTMQVARDWIRERYPELFSE